MNTDLLLPLMKNIVAPLFSDEEFVNMLIEAMKADPDLEVWPYGRRYVEGFT